MDSKQLYEKQSNQYNPFFPIVRLEDIIDKIADKSIQWILNNYNHIYIEYSESREITRDKVPQMLRRSGLWISYNNGKKNITEYYLGENTNVNNYLEWTSDDNWKEFDELIIQDKTITYQHLSDALRELVAGGNTITNFPDEEDITSDGTVLSFKDREYDPHTFSGLGRIILRKNLKIVDKQYKNILTQEMINKENTIYEIRYDFDLGGKEIVVPEGCVFDFQGGSLINGSIIGNNTKISANIYSIFKDVKISGKWKCSNVYVRWFNIEADVIEDKTSSIQQSIDFASICNAFLHFDEGIYYIYGNTHEKSLVPKKNVSYIGHNTILKMMSKRCNIFSNATWYFEDNGYLEGMSDIDNVVFENITFDGNSEQLGDPYEKGEKIAGDNYSYGIYLMKASNIKINNCKFINFVYGGHNLWGCKNQIITNNYYTNIATIANAYFGQYTAMGSDGSRKYPSYNVYYSRNIIENCGGGILRCNAGGNYGTAEHSISFKFEHNIAKNCNGNISINQGNYINIDISKNTFINTKGITIDPMLTSAEYENQIQGVFIENNVFISDDLITPIAEGRALFTICAVPNIIIKNNIVKYNVFPETANVFKFNVLENNNSYLEFEKSITIENNFINVKRARTVIVLPPNRNLILYNNTFDVYYVSETIIRCQEDNSNKIIINNNNFTNIDTGKLFNNKPINCKATNNEGFITCLEGKLMIKNNQYIDVPFRLETFNAVINSHNKLLTFNIADSKKRITFYVKDFTGNDIIDPEALYEIYYKITGEYYNYIKTPLITPK